MSPILRKNPKFLNVSVYMLQALLFAPAGVAASLDVVATDTAGQPVPGVQLRLKISTNVLYSSLTGADGRGHFQDVKPGSYELVAAKTGFEPSGKTDVDLTTAAPASIELTLLPSQARRDSVDVNGSIAPVEQSASSPAQLPAQITRELPGRPATVLDALPLVPGVIRQPGGGLMISGAGEHRSALVVNSADVTDPATGQFGLSVPIDVVETLNVYQTPFLAEFGRFTAGVVSVETRRGGEKWKLELNDPFPDFFIRSYHLRGVRDATPRLNLEGPLIDGKLYFSEGFNYEVRKTAVYELSFPNNQKKQEGLNSFTQLDWIISGTQMVTATFHVAPERFDFVNLDYFNPPSTTPDGSTRNYTSTVADKVTIGGGILDTTFSFTRFDARVWGQGQQDFAIAPQGNSGNYFAQQHRQADRISWAPTFSSAAIQWLGNHSLKAGVYVAGTSEQAQVTQHPIDLMDAAGQMFEQIQFTGGQPFRMRDVEEAFFIQDHWMVSPKLAVDLGVRTESQELSESLRVAPRAGVAWTPFARAGTVFRAGFGLFYDRLPLNVYSFNRYPTEAVSFFDAAGHVTAGPFLYQNLLGTVGGHIPFVIREQSPGNFSPRSATGSVQIEQPLSSHLKLRIGYMQSESAGLVVLNHLAPDPVTGAGVNVLTGSGLSRYHQFEASARLRWNDKRQMFFSYVRSSARGDLNDFSTFLGTFGLPVLRGNQFGNLPSDLPNRFLAWGLLQLPWGFRVAPLIEYRNGFAYAALNAAQNWVGTPYSSRFPNFFSADARISKDFRITPKYTVRFSINSYNLTNHFNPEAVHTNIDDPAYGHFFGQRGQHFTADFDVIF